MPKLLRKQLIAAQKLMKKSLSMEDLGEQTDIVALENKVNGQTPLTINQTLILEALNKYNSELAKGNESNPRMVEQYFSEALGHFFAARKLLNFNIKNINKLDADFIEKTGLTQNQIDFAALKLVGATSIEDSNIDFIDERGYTTYLSEDALENIKIQERIQMQQQQYSEIANKSDVKVSSEDPDEKRIKLDASIRAEEKNSDRNQELKDKFESSFKNGQTTNNVLFDRDFFEKFLEDFSYLKTMENKPDNGEDLYKTIDKSNKTRKELESSEVTKIAQREIAGTRIKDYLLIKQKVENRTWGDIFSHPWKSLMETITLYQTKNILKNSYGFNDNALNEIENICYKNQSFDKDFYALDKNGNKYSYHATQEDIKAEYNAIKKEEADFEKVQGVLVSSSDSLIEIKNEGRNKLQNIENDTNMYEKNNVNAERKTAESQINDPSKVKDNF